MTEQQTITINDSLALTVYRHGFFLADRTRQAWTFKTNGLTRECCLTLLIEDDSEDTYPDIAVRLFKLMAERLNDSAALRPGRTLRLGKNGFLGFHALVFVPAAQFDGLPSLKDHLALLLIHQAEYENSRRYGIGRLLTAIASQCSVFPFPVWNTILRPPVTDSWRGQTLLDDETVHRSETAVTIDRRRITLQMRNDAGLQLTARALPGEAPETLLCGPPSGTQAALTWDGGKQRALTTTPSPERMSAAFVRFVPGPVNYHEATEDGLTLHLNAATRQALADAMAAQRPLEIALVNHRLVVQPDTGSLYAVAQTKAMWLGVRPETVQVHSISAPDETDLMKIDRFGRGVLRFLAGSMSDEMEAFVLTLTSTPGGYDIAADIELNPEFTVFLQDNLPAAAECTGVTLVVGVNQHPGPVP